MKNDNKITSNILQKIVTAANDSVHHPAHYCGKHECLAVIEDLELEYHLGNAMKYLWRAGRKDPSKKIEDLQKAVFYINRKIELLREGGQAS